ncbi:MAG: hypothetical protein HY854_01140 [Burkholderiales bacterium]|nr:hypothetical protein [Burkholderiales bacterium]
MKKLLSGCLLLAATLAGPAVAQDAKCAVLLMHGRGASPQAVAALGKKLPPVCAVRSPDMPWSARRGEGGDGAAEIQRHVKDLRSQGFKRVLLAGQGAGANAAMAYAGGAGDVEGVIALAPDDEAALAGITSKMKQHVPLLWVVSQSAPLHAKGEAYAFAKAPPHPASRYLALKAEGAVLPDAAGKAVVEWVKALE